MDYKELIEQMKEWNELFISEMCADDKFSCYDLCDGKDCIVCRATTAIETLLAERDKAQEQLLDIQETLDMYGGEYGITAAFQKAEERDAPVVHGRWIVASGNPTPYCSECRKEAIRTFFGGYANSEHCPRCGAKMDLPNGE